MNTEDRRIRKTKKALREALAELIQKKELNHITVQELSDKADLHRATFYSHYKDIYDLYQQMEDVFIEELNAILTYDSSQHDNTIFQSLFNYIDDNQKIFQIFLYQHSRSRLLNRFVELAEQNYTLMWKHDLGDLVYSDEWNIYSRYHIHGCLGIIIYWIETEFSYPKEEVIKMISNLDQRFDEFIVSKKPAM